MTRSNYDLFQQAAFNRPDHYPLTQTVSPELYRPLAPWLGRLILPPLDQRATGDGVWFEVHLAPPGQHELVGQVVWLRWSADRAVQARVWPVARDVYFTGAVEKSMAAGLLHPQRLHRWRLVTPLESLAGARPADDMLVKLNGPVEVIPGSPASLTITHEPVQITGRYYGLVTFTGPVQADEGLFAVTHFNRASRRFDGPTETVRLPQTVKDTADIYRSTNRGIESDPLNREGWYIYGAKDSRGLFVVQALAPLALLRLQPQQTINGFKPAATYLKKETWKDTTAQKGKTSSVLLNGGAAPQPVWQEGDQALVVNSYGGIGNDREPYPYPGGLYFGHFSYGWAQVVREPLADDLIFDIEYFQVFSSNGDGLVPGVLHWTRYLGDRQFGYLGYRPVCDILLKLDCFIQPYHLEGQQISVLGRLKTMLEGVLHLYRIGGGTGGVFFGMANNCTQDSNQALYGAVRDIDTSIKEHPIIQTMLHNHPDQADRFERLVRLGQSLKKTLIPLGGTRADWRYNFHLIDTSLAESSLITTLRGLSSWRTITPHWASNAVAQVFLQHGASAWVLRANQVGNYDPAMLPKAIDP